VPPESSIARFTIGQSAENVEPSNLSDEEDKADVPSDFDYYASSEGSVITVYGISAGDTEGVLPGAGEEIIVTQPAIDDVDQDFWPDLDNRDKDQLDKFTVCFVYASSGLRRWHRDGLVHEID
jgi:hypothetical protein